MGQVSFLETAGSAMVKSDFGSYIGNVGSGQCQMCPCVSEFV